MIVGFVIQDFNGHEKDAVEFIRSVCVLDSPELAQNIVDAGPGLNIFTENVTSGLLASQPFSCVPIETQDDKFILVSIVNFNLELVYNNEILRLVPTEYVYILPDEVIQFETYIQQGLVKTIPEFFDKNQKWILETGYWDDNGRWIDTAQWRD